ncbi:hypothetical protein [Streptomyces vilmorinianum]|uniref:hypothetical protein n=1 Tax=Streptomyces vilmorinianum TaxID=3051092 RepID=UPI0010FB841B|nr:hypothetical protein [Streptomyces vilmorinianum]
MTTPTTRVRLHGGRLTHAAQPRGSGHATACGISLDANAVNHWMPHTATVTCRPCQRKTGDGR